MQLARLRCQLHSFLCGFDVSVIYFYLAAGDQFPERRYKKSFLPSSYSGHPAENIFPPRPFIDATGYAGGEEGVV